jgi:hypothetical protein
VTKNVVEKKDFLPCNLIGVEKTDQKDFQLLKGKKGTRSGW